MKLDIQLYFYEKKEAIITYLITATSIVLGMFYFGAPST